MRWFGVPWSAAICEAGERVQTPVGAPCDLCGNAVRDGDRGVVLPHLVLPEKGIEVTSDSDRKRMSANVSIAVELRPIHIRCALAHVLPPGLAELLTPPAVPPREGEHLFREGDRVRFEGREWRVTHLCGDGKPHLTPLDGASGGCEPHRWRDRNVVTLIGEV